MGGNRFRPGSLANFEKSKTFDYSLERFQSNAKRMLLQASRACEKGRFCLFTRSEVAHRPAATCRLSGTLHVVVIKQKCTSLVFLNVYSLWCNGPAAGQFSSDFC